MIKNLLLFYSNSFNRFTRLNAYGNECSAQYPCDSPETLSSPQIMSGNYTITYTNRLGNNNFKTTFGAHPPGLSKDKTNGGMNGVRHHPQENDADDYGFQSVSLSTKAIDFGIYQKKNGIYSRIDYFGCEYDSVAAPGNYECMRAFQLGNLAHKDE